MRHLIVTATAAALFGAACAHGGSQSSSTTAATTPTGETTAQTSPQATGTMRPGAMCPMTVPGTQVAASDTDTGEVLTFTTTSPDHVAELRNRVRAMADMHNQHHAGREMGTGGMMGPGSADTTAMSMPPPSTATVEDTDQGARIVLTPRDTAQLSQLQTTVREHAAVMQAQGRCAMGGMHESDSMDQPAGSTSGY